MPSFALQLKNELARRPLLEYCCAASELRAFLQINGRLIISANQAKIALQTENVPVARRLFSLFKYCFNVIPEVSFYRQRRLQKNIIFKLQITEKKVVLKVLGALGFITFKKDHPFFSLKSPAQQSLEQDLSKKCCLRAYLRGAFLAGGSLINPEKDYHLEIAAPYEYHAFNIKNVLAAFDLEAKFYEKKGKYIIYLKEAEKIGELLRVMASVNSLLKFENIRIVKSVRNKINRLVNCETANLTRTVFASQQQIGNIKLIQKTLGLEKIPPSLREVARLRLSYPEATLRELGAKATPPLSKSGVNHRLRRLKALARKLGEEQE